MTKERYNQIVNEVYKNYLGKYKQDKTPGIVYYTDPLQFRPYTEEEFTNRIKTDNEFSERWGLKIEERELSLDERKQIFDDRGYVCDVWPFNGDWHGEYDGFRIPRRAISLTYNNETIEIR